MREVFLYQPLGDAQGTGELMARHRSASQEFNDALPCGLFGRRHGDMVGTHAKKSQSALSGFMGNHLKLSELMGSHWLHSSVHSVRMHPRIDCHITINQVGRTSPSYSRMV
ncbi:MAG: hypothetical protein CCU26_19175 [Nitrospira sp. UW-LDO-01]|nr:MAG: hypothetical protein CCU26_19175 [Nitrospira sp. UW-LDO-01]